MLRPTLFVLLATAYATPADPFFSPLPPLPLPGITDPTHLLKLDHSCLAPPYLFLSAKENSTLSILDLDAGAFVTSLPIPFPQGVAYAPPPA